MIRFVQKRTVQKKGDPPPSGGPPPTAVVKAEEAVSTEVAAEVPADTIAE